MNSKATKAKAWRTTCTIQRTVTLMQVTTTLTMDQTHSMGIHRKATGMARHIIRLTATVTIPGNMTTKAHMVNPTGTKWDITAAKNTPRKDIMMVIKAIMDMRDISSKALWLGRDSIGRLDLGIVGTPSLLVPGPAQ
jgi:hypothetical protein